MGNLNIAVLGAKDYASKIGKKGTVTDMTFYDHKAGTDSFTLIEPSKYPEKLSSLFYSVAMSEFAILVVDKIDSFLGETIVMTDALGIDRGWIILQNYIQPEQLKPLLAGTSLEGYEYKEDDPIKREVILKSIQKHDLDADDGVKGDHVGLALRGIESDELDRGYVVTTDPSVKMSRKVEGKVSLVKYWPSPLKEGMVLHIGHWMQMVPCRVTAVDDGDDFRSATVTFDLESDMIHKPGDRAIIMYLEGGKLRVAGSVVLN